MPDAAIDGAEPCGDEMRSQIDVDRRLMLVQTGVESVTENRESIAARCTLPIPHDARSSARDAAVATGR